MEVKDKIMFHLHTLNDYDKDWKEGTTLKVDDNFYGYASRTINEFNTRAPFETKKTLDMEIYNYLQNKELDQKELIRLLIESRAMIYKTNILKRENALEEIRKEMFNHLPSRKHCLFVTTKEGVDYWKKKLVPEKYRYKLALFELSLTGDLFRSNAGLLPNPETTYEQALNQSKNYWNPNLELTNSKEDEYLFKGNAKIIKQLKL